MSAGGDLLQDTDLAREPVKEPAKRWRNWWVAKNPNHFYCVHCGSCRFADRGEQFSDHCAIYPSKDIAESDAAKWLDAEVEEYLGAYPEGERP